MTEASPLTVPNVGQRRASLWQLRWRVMRRLASQELRDGLWSWPIYIVAAAGLLVAVLLTYNSLSFVASSKLQILSRPFYLPLLIVTTLALLYITAWAVLAIVRPREQGALRVLFFAPVDPISLLVGHILAGLALYSILALITTPILVILALLTNLPFSPLLIVGMVVSPVFAVPAVAAGLFLSTIARSSRSAMFLFVAAVLVVMGLQVGYSALLRVPPTSTYYDALLFLRELLRTIRDSLNWVSPLALLTGGLDAALRASWPELLLRAGVALIGSGVWLWLAIWGLGRRGVLP